MTDVGMRPLSADLAVAGLRPIRRRKSARDLLQKALYTVGLASSPLRGSPAEERLLQGAGVSALPPSSVATGLTFVASLDCQP